ncbi:MAG: uncharacterized protein A8A55_0290 [Amphiamblys sp. WSBS2006]|nr:MAG: uncharacterized protein A8A55_0290 [Amphiamblys sp. WSBS2006]
MALGAFMLVLSSVTAVYVLPFDSFSPGLLKEQRHRAQVGLEVLDTVKNNFAVLLSQKNAGQIEESFPSNTLSPLFHAVYFLKHLGPTAVIYETPYDEKAIRRFAMFGTQIVVVSPQTFSELSYAAQNGVFRMQQTGNIKNLFSISFPCDSLMLELCLVAVLSSTIFVVLWICTAYAISTPDTDYAQLLETSPEKTAKLKTQTYNADIEHNWPDCAICLDGFEHNDTLRVLPCTHTFHVNCIDPWLQRRARWCPICRKEAYTIDTGGAWKTVRNWLFGIPYSS